jgi:hypothetical protein
MTTNTAIFAGFGLALGAVAVGVWGAKGTRGLNGASGRRGLRGPHEVRELQLFCENDGDLYRQQVQPIEKNLAKKITKGIFDKTKAVKLWGYLADNCARKYAKEFGDGSPWHKMFSTADRREVAKAFNESFMRENGVG